MRSYAINLSRSPDRLAHMKAQLERSGIGYEVVTAVDGLDLDLDDPETAAVFASSYRNSDCFQATPAAGRRAGSR